MKTFLHFNLLSNFIKEIYFLLFSQKIGTIWKRIYFRLPIVKLIWKILAKNSSCPPLIPTTNDYNPFKFNNMGDFRYNPQLPKKQIYFLKNKIKQNFDILFDLLVAIGLYVTY